MPSLARVLQQDDLKVGGHVMRMDLSPYIDIIESIRSEGGVGGEVAILDDESRRTEKRRLSIAAKQLETTLTWRRSADGMLRFVLSEPGAPTPGGRPRNRAQAAQTGTQNGRKRERSRG